MSGNICILIHCLQKPGDPAPRVHPELFVTQESFDRFARELLQEGYVFDLASSKRTDRPICSVTFDDGYANNLHFVPLAEKYQIPFVLFVNSLNIENGFPFVWDAAALANQPITNPARTNYSEGYARLKTSVDALKTHPAHRPLSLSELEELSKNPYARLAPHSHTHQPITQEFATEALASIDQNVAFLSRFKGALLKDFSLPCGLYTPWTIQALKGRFDRIYTINARNFSLGDPLIHRISLISEEAGGPLIQQVKNSLRFVSRIKRGWTTVKYSNSLLNRNL